MFKIAKPISVKELQGVMNSYATFVAKVPSLKNAKIQICAADYYRLTVNGRFVATGPARAAKGYARLDEISLDEYAKEGENIIVISVAGYYCRSLSTVLQPMFLWAEVVKDETVIAATGKDFVCYLSDIKKFETERYSVQRHFIEEWDLTKPCFEKTGETFVVENPPKPIKRLAPYPDYTDVLLQKATVKGTTSTDSEIKARANFYSFLPSERWGRYLREQIEKHSYEWVQRQIQNPSANNVDLPLNLDGGEYATFDFSRIETGFLRLSGVANEKTEIVIAFAELSSSEKFTFTDTHAHNVVDLTVSGEFDFISFEPYTLRYAAVFVKNGSLKLSGFGIKNYGFDISKAEIPDEIVDEKLKKIYSSAMRTFAHNAVDIYTDCPSRERSGWLCDSYFTSKTEYCLTKKTAVEDAFLENFVLYKNEGEYPQGVLPMTYPADDQDDATFIPQWTMWYILEVEDYVNNRGHEKDVEKFRESVYGLINFYARYENADGLLESLPSWNFIEWSRANDWTKDVSYPTNFLYAEVLRCVARLYGDKVAAEKAEKVAKTAVSQSFNGKVFLDHAVREDGKLVLQSDCSETCQYYAMLFGGIDLKSTEYSELYRLVTEVFGAGRTTLLEEIAPINAFIGAYLRLEALLKMNENDVVIESIKTFFGDMANTTGTLWELREPRGSQDHGFASYALVAMRKALGIDK